jgi:thiol-disulfide isomerase/thioredoxin
MRAIAIIGLTLLAGLPVVRVVKYDGLTEEVLKHRGKVVLVDFWSTLCTPCRKKFPDLLVLQEKYGKDGFVFLPVSIDEINENFPADKVKAKVLKDLEYLRTLRKELGVLKVPESLILEGWEPIVKDKLHFDGTIPCLFLFNRQGKWMKYGGGRDAEVHVEEIEKQVVEFLKQK